MTARRHAWSVTIGHVDGPRVRLGEYTSFGRALGAAKRRALETTKRKHDRNVYVDLWMRRRGALQLVTLILRPPRRS